MIQENLIKKLKKTNERFTEEELAFDDFVWDRINKTDTKKMFVLLRAVTPTFDSTDFINVKHKKHWDSCLAGKRKCDNVVHNVRKGKENSNTEEIT